MPGLINLQALQPGVQQMGTGLFRLMAMLNPMMRRRLGDQGMQQLFGEQGSLPDQFIQNAFGVQGPVRAPTPLDVQTGQPLGAQTVDMAPVGQPLGPRQRLQRSRVASARNRLSNVANRNNQVLGKPTLR
jgi:hypothetical protein